MNDVPYSSLEIALRFTSITNHTLLGVTHLPEVQCINLLSVLGAVRTKDMPDGEHKAAPPAFPEDSDRSPSNGGSGRTSHEGTSARPSIDSSDNRFPLLCLVLATDGVW